MQIHAPSAHRLTVGGTLAAGRVDDLASALALAGAGQIEEPATPLSAAIRAAAGAGVPLRLRAERGAWAAYLDAFCGAHGLALWGVGVHEGAVHTRYRLPGMAAVRTLPGEVAVPVPALILRGFVPASAPDAAGRPRRAHVLLVDGAAGMRAGMTFVLAAVGYRTTQAASAAEAVRLYAAERPDAVVVAVALPDAPAGQGIDLIRRIDPDAVCVASGTREQIPELLDAQILRGARGWILTPLVEQGQVLRRTIDGLTA